MTHRAARVLSQRTCGRRAELSPLIVSVTLPHFYQFEVFSSLDGITMDGEKRSYAGVDNLACWIGDEEDGQAGSGAVNKVKARMAVSSPPLSNNKNVIEDKVVDDEKTPIDFDDVLPHVGEFGPYQIILFFLTAPFCFFLAFSYFTQVFITLVPDHTCHVPQLNSSFTQLTITQK